jgi:hypothetical protein
MIPALPGCDKVGKLATMWIKCSKNFVVSFIVNLVGSSNCSRIDKAYDKAYDKVSFLMQSKQYRV